MLQPNCRWFKPWRERVVLLKGPRTYFNRWLFFSDFLRSLHNHALNYTWRRESNPRQWHSVYPVKDLPCQMLHNFRKSYQANSVEPIRFSATPYLGTLPLAISILLIDWNTYCQQGNLHQRIVISFSEKLKSTLTWSTRWRFNWIASKTMLGVFLRFFCNKNNEFLFKFFLPLTKKVFRRTDRRFLGRKSCWWCWSVSEQFQEFSNSLSSGRKHL